MASGAAALVGLDTTVMRVLFVIIAAVTGGTAVVAYLLAWALLPLPGAPETRLEATLRERNFVALAVGAILLFIVFGTADNAWGGGWGWGWHRLLTPLALVGAGVALLLHLDRDRHRSTSSPSGPPSPSDPTIVGRFPEAGSDATEATVTATAATTAAIPWWAAPPKPLPLPSVRPSPTLRNATLGTACLFAAACTLLGALGVFTVSARLVLGGMLMIVAAGILVSAWWGRRRGLLPVAVLLSVAVGVACIPGLSLAGGIGHRVERPITLAEVPRAYRLGVGTSRIDLTKLALPTDHVLRITAGLGAGRLIIDVPRTAQVDLSGHISAGAVQIDGRDVGLNGVDVDLHRQLPAASDAPRLDLRIDAAFADVEVRRVS